jgi:regulatory subunit for Cdc7p protein kinase
MAAAVFIPPSPHDPFSKMATSSRRVPLASLANATNSPHRPLTHSGTKRPRSLANLPQQENEPPQKRLAAEKTTRVVAGPVTPQKHARPSAPEGRVFERDHGESRSTAFERKLVAARERDRTVGQRATKTVATPAEEHSMKEWRRQYRKLFPTFRFYFDGFSDEAKSRFLRQISTLGGVCRVVVRAGVGTDVCCSARRPSSPKMSHI